MTSLPGSRDASFTTRLVKLDFEEWLLSKEREALVRYVKHMLKGTNISQDLWEDICQDVDLKLVVLSLEGKYDPDLGHGTPLPLAKKIAKHRIIEMVQQRETATIAFSDLDEEELLDFEDQACLTPERIIEEIESSKMSKEFVAKVLAKLKPDVAEMLELQYGLEMPGRQVAIKMKMSYPACRKSISRAAAKVRKNFKKLEL